jgi:predicted acylesterase/phospholipase RssA
VRRTVVWAIRWAPWLGAGRVGARYTRSVGRVCTMGMGVLAVIGVCGTPLRAQESASQVSPTESSSRVSATNPTVPLALTVSGGVSLGAYQSGYLYYVTEALQRGEWPRELKLATGASAGSVNALLSLLHACGKRSVPAPESSLFWQTWTPVGLADLYDVHDVDGVHVFSRRALRRVMKQIEKVWFAGLPASCDVVLGVSVTRLEPEQLRLGQGYRTLPRTEEKFALRITGRGPGRAPQLRNYVDPNYPLPEALLPVDDSDREAFDALTDLLLASAAFPVAFAPQPVSYCVHVPSPANQNDISAPPVVAPQRPTETPKCSLRHARTSLFIDGGIFDNSPVRLSSRLSASGFVSHSNGSVVWRPVPDTRVTQVSETTDFMLVDADNKAYPQATDGVTDGYLESVLDLVTHLAGTFVETARAKELVTLIESQPALSPRVHVSENRFPRASEHLYAFFGFFERDFRVFDFYLGMYDAYSALSEMRKATPLDAGASRGAMARQSLADERRTDGRWAPFHCLRALYDQDASLRTWCDHVQPNLRVLLQVSLDRLFDNCHRLVAEVSTPTTTHALCRAGMRFELPPSVPSVRAIKKHQWRRQADEPEVVYALRLLANYQFEFRDLGLKRSEAKRAPLVISSRVRSIGKVFASKQESGAMLVDLASRVGGNVLAYVPPARSVYFLMGSRLEAGYSFTDPLGPRNWLRPTFAVAVDGLLSLLSSETARIAATPYVGVELEPTGWNSASMQWRLGLRGGFRFSSIDGWVAGDCTGVEPDICSGPEAQSYLALSLFSVLRLQMGLSYMPPFRTRGPHQWVLYPSLGVQFDDLF